jgi:hypothetical protein
MVAVDNDVEDVFFNGVRISTPQTHADYPSLDNFRFDVPQPSSGRAEASASWRSAEPSVSGLRLLGEVNRGAGEARRVVPAAEVKGGLLYLGFTSVEILLTAWKVMITF